MQERSEMQQRQGYQAVEKLRETLDEKYLWEVILLYAGESFKTYTGLPFTYEVRKGRNGDYTRELWIDRRENSKSLALSSVLLALRNIKKVGAVVDRPKALGDIRGVSYIYGSVCESSMRECCQIVCCQIVAFGVTLSVLV